MDSNPDIFTPWRATKFYIPLFLQAISQSLTYPLVAAIVSHGVDGVSGYAAFAQGHAVMFTINSWGSGLITTGMIFCRDLPGLRQYRLLNLTVTTVLLLVQFLFCFPPGNDLVFHGLLGLTAPLDRIARDTMLTSLTMQAGFFFRNEPLALLYNAKRSGAANLATAARIALTAAFTPLFLRFGMTGPMWGVVAITVPLLLEMWLCKWMAREEIRKLPAESTQTADFRTQLRFLVPLSIGGFLLAIANFMVAAFISRTPQSAKMLAMHYVAAGLGNPMGYAAWRMQSVVLGFPPRHRHDHSMFWYSLCCGFVLAAMPFVFQIPYVSNWYFGKVQNILPEDIHLATEALLVFSFLPCIQSLRGHAEGLAAFYRRPSAVMAGQAAFLVSLVLALSLQLHFGAPGHQMGAFGIIFAAFCTMLTIHTTSYMIGARERKRQRPSPDSA